MRNIFVITFFLALVFPVGILAAIGVGVGTGKIQVQDQLKPGIIYELPPLTVLNTGDEPSDYEVAVTYNEKQTELKPTATWFVFNPQRFHLDPGKAQIVNIKLNLPIRAKPGDYFAYLEGHPIKKTQVGQTSIGVAAAAKLYFTVVPANVLSGVYYKVVSFWQVYAPWPQRVLELLGISLILFLARKYLKINIGLKKSE